MEINFNTTLFFAALGLACIFEALPWILMPFKMRNFLLTLADQPEKNLRLYGCILLIIGLLILWFTL